MDELDLVADLNAQDDDGFGWSTLADAVAADRVRPGATLLALRCGASLVKLVRLDDIPNARPIEPERLEAATGLRYWTIPVLNHDEVVAECERAGVLIVKPTVHVPENGARFTLLADPDGNIVEILGYPEETST